MGAADFEREEISQDPNRRRGITRDFSQRSDREKFWGYRRFAGGLLGPEESPCEGLEKLGRRGLSEKSVVEDDATLGLSLKFETALSAHTSSLLFALKSCDYSIAGRVALPDLKIRSSIRPEVGWPLNKVFGLNRRWLR